MITRILEARESCQQVLDYNEEKVLEGNAMVVAGRNIDSTCSSAIYDTFQRYEQNPAISERRRRHSFHMTVGPAPEDGMTEARVLDYIDDVMQGLGYGEQPYVVYRHNDIDREHYHIASLRVDANGKGIDRHFEGVRLLELERSLAPKYGFTVGRQGPAAKDRTVAADVKEFRKGDANVMNNLTSLFMKALKYDFHSLYQFSCIMQAMNVSVSLRARKDGGKNVILRGLDENGRKCTRYYSMERHMGVQGGELFSGHLKQNNEMGVIRASRKEQLLEMSDYCLQHSGSLEEYRWQLAELGVRMSALRDENTGYIRRITLVDVHNQAIVDSSVSGELFAAAFSSAESNGHWTAPPATGDQKKKPGRRRKGSGPAAVVERKAFFTPERKAELNARIRARLDVFTGKGREAVKASTGKQTPRLK